MSKVLTEVRARIIWGEKPDEIIIELGEAGMPVEQAHALVNVVVKERHQIIREMGKQKILMGLGVCFASILIALLYLYWFEPTFTTRHARALSIIPLLCALNFFYGLAKTTDGYIKLQHPERIQGCLAADSD